MTYEHSNSVRDIENICTQLMDDKLTAILSICFSSEEERLHMVLYKRKKLMFLKIIRPCWKMLKNLQQNLKRITLRIGNRSMKNWKKI